MKKCMVSWYAFLVACCFLPACSSIDPVAYQDISSSAYLQSNSNEKTGHIPYHYATQVNWNAYSKAIVDPVEIYRGQDNQFGDMSEEDKAILAQYMRSQFSQKLATRFQLTQTPGPATLRIHLVLTGAAENTPVLSTFTRLDLSGGLYNAVQAVRGKEGIMTGSVVYALEIYDSVSNTLLDASIVKQYPGAYNIVATIGSLAAAKTGIEKGAEEVVNAFN